MWPRSLFAQYSLSYHFTFWIILKKSWIWKRSSFLRKSSQTSKKFIDLKIVHEKSSTLSKKVHWICRKVHQFRKNFIKFEKKFNEFEIKFIEVEEKFIKFENNHQNWKKGQRIWKKFIEFEKKSSFILQKKTWKKEKILDFGKENLEKGTRKVERIKKMCIIIVGRVAWWLVRPLSKLEGSRFDSPSITLFLPYKPYIRGDGPAC